LYSLPQPVGFTNIHYLLSSLVFIAALGLLVKFRKRRWLVFATLFYFLSIFFLLRFDQGDVSIVADRFMYLPSLGFCMLLGLIFDNLLNRPDTKPFFQKRVAVVLLTVLFVFLTIKTFMQCRIWNNSFTFWEYVAEKNPGASTAYLNMGTSYVHEGDFKKAIYFLNKAVSINKNNLRGYSNLGTAHFHLGQFGQAIKYLKSAILIKPNYTPALNSLGLVYLEKGDYANAEKYFLEAIDKGSKFLEPRNNLAIVYKEQNKYLQAEKLYIDNLALDPNHYQSLYSLLDLYMRENRKEKLIELGRRIVKTNRDVEALLRFGSALAENNYSEIAIAFLTQAIQLDSQCKIAFVLLGNIYGNYQKFDKAIAFWQEALKIDPHDAALRNQIEKVKDLETIPEK
jgi:tetratricopeptide (TPR) repeat protein